MELREFMGIFRPVNNSIKFFGETVGITKVQVQLAAVIEEDVKKFAALMKREIGEGRKHEIKNLEVPNDFIRNLADLIADLPTDVLFAK